MNNNVDVRYVIAFISITALIYNLIKTKYMMMRILRFNNEVIKLNEQMAKDCDKMAKDRDKAFEFANSAIETCEKATKFAETAIDKLSEYMDEEVDCEEIWH